MLTSYRSIMDLLLPPERRQFHGLVVASILMGLIDAFSVAAIIPFLSVVADPDVIDRQPLLMWLEGYSWGNERGDFIVFLGALVFAIVVTGILCRATTFYFITRFSRLRAYSLAMRLFEGYLAREYSWHAVNHSAGLGRTILDEVREVVNGPIAATLRLIANSVVALLLIALLIALEPVAALAMATVLLVGYGSVFVLLRRKAARLGRVWKAGNESRFQIVQEALSGIREVKVFGLERAYLDRYSEPALKVARTVARIATYAELPRHALEAFAFGGMLIFIIVLTSTQNGDLATIIPILGVYAFAGFRLFPLVQQIYASTMTVRSGQPMMAAIAAQLQSSAKLNPDTAEPPMEIPPQISMDAVSYRYPGVMTDALVTVNLQITPGEVVGLVGTTGAGKTTLVDILLGLLSPSSGAILLNGVPLDGPQLQRWRRSLGYVPQNLFLVDDTLAANIAFGVAPSEIDAGQVERAAQTAQISDFIDGLPQKYDTVVGERGVRLSGGQRQRIAIARALYRDPPVLIFDEATSALDTITEAAVIAALRKSDTPRTLIMIAHRLDTLRSCDLIHILEEGKIVASDSFAALSDQNAKFRTLLRGN